MNIKFYDAHIHFIFQQAPSDLKNIFLYLEGIGLAGFVALVIAEYPSDMGTIRKMVPQGFHDRVSLEIFAKQKEPFLLFSQTPHLEIVPYLDARFIETNIEQKIENYRALGFKGMKLLYVPEEDSTMGLSGMQHAFGRHRKQSERITSLLIESASAHGMSILVHADLRRYSDFISEMIKAHPMTNFNIPHFGFSRREISSLLEEYENCYTDLSSLAAFVKKEPETYLEFIRRYKDKILFGSDALIGGPEVVQSTRDFFFNFLSDKALLTRVFSKNYLEFHKRSNKL
jgi:hypothetical protein